MRKFKSIFAMIFCCTCLSAFANEEITISTEESTSSEGIVSQHSEDAEAEVVKN